jgi:kelch-like protein 21
LQDVDPNAVLALVQFCYTSKIQILQENAQQLLTTACFLQVDEVKDYVCEFLELELDVTNCFDIKDLAQTFTCDRLTEAATRFIQYHFTDLVAEPRFEELRLDQLTEVISLGNLRVESELQVYDAVVRWTRADTAARAPQMHLVLRHVRLPLLEPDFPTADVDLLTSNPICAKLIADARDFVRLPKERRPKAMRWWSRPRHRGKKCVRWIQRSRR